MEVLVSLCACFDCMWTGLVGCMGLGVLLVFLVVLMVLLAEAVDAIERFWGEDAEAVDAIERFWGEDALVWDSEGMEEVLQLIQAFTICIDKRVEIL